MRDPAGTIEFLSSSVVRQLTAPLADEHFLNSDLANHWVESGHLVKFEIAGPQTIVAERIPFVTLPTEWTDAQFHAAAALTLALQSEAIDAGFDLKDASAWNIIFEGTRPTFCDLLSFAHLHDKKWWAAGQFARHFLIPLAVSQRRGVLAHQTFKVWRDGMPPDVGRQLLGPGRFLTRYWPLVASAHSSTDSQKITPASPTTLTEIQSFRRGLHASFSWMLAGTKPRSGHAASGHWKDYTDNRSHYESQALLAKQQQVHAWLENLRPDWVADFGCNTGEFSQIAASCGANVVAIDADHDAVQNLYLANCTKGNRIFPVLALLDDLSGARGWAGAEFPGLVSRLEQQFDVVMMLALIHHLAVSASIPLETIARFAAQCTKKWLIVELIGADDPQMQLLCTRHLRIPGEFSTNRQRDAFLTAGFVLEAENLLLPSSRTLLLLRRPE